MEESEDIEGIIYENEKAESIWAKFLDYSRFYAPAEINNISQELFKKDFINVK